MAEQLTKPQAFMLGWLETDDGALGECEGPTLDGLVAAGLAAITPTPRGGGWNRVSITEAGRQALQASRSGASHG